LWPDTDLKNSVNGTLQELLGGAMEHNRLTVEERVGGIAFAPDDKTIATWTLDNGKLQLWKGDGTPFDPPWMKEIPRVSTVAFSGDGKIAVAVGNEIAFRKLENGESWTVWSVDNGLINAIAFSADGNKLATATTDAKNVGRIQLWNLNNGSLLTLEDPGMTVQMAVAFSPDGEQIAVTGWYGAFLWKADGTKQKELVHDFSSVNAVSFSPDGTMIATGGSDKMIKLWNRDGTLKQTLYGHADAVWGLSFRPDSHVVASGSNDRTVKEWQTHDGTLLATLAGHRDGVRAVSYSHDGKTLASASDDGTVKLWERARTALKALTHDQTVYAAAVSPDGKIILTTSGNGWVTLWNQDGAVLTTQRPQLGPITAVAFSREGKMVATAASDRTVHLWSIEGVGTLRAKGFLEGQRGERDQNAVLALRFSPDGKSIVAGGEGGEVKVWSTDDLKKRQALLPTTENGGILGVDFSHDGRNIVVAYQSGRVVVVGSENGRLAYTLQAGGSESAPVSGIRYSPDGKTIAAYTDDAINRWTAEGKPLTPLSNHDSALVGFAFGPDGNTVATASKDGTLKIWAEDGTLMKTLSGHEGVGDDIAVNRVAFSPDGKTVAAANEGRNVILWNWQEDLSLDGTLAEACRWIRDYLTNNSKVVSDHRHLCDGIIRQRMEK
jgi:WD40 repeat protein